MPVTYLIDSSFFVNELEIPNSDDTNVAAAITSFIQKYEPQCLLRILGYSLYKSYQADPASTRMTDLINGVEYSVNGVLNYWKGLKYDPKQSLIASYIYWFWQQNEATKSSGLGTVIPKGASLVSVAPLWKMQAAWNTFSNDTNDMASFLRRKKDGDGNLVYPEFTYLQSAITLNVSRPLGL